MFLFDLRARFSQRHIQNDHSKVNLSGKKHLIFAKPLAVQAPKAISMQVLHIVHTVPEQQMLP